MSYFRNKATLGFGFAATFPLTIYFFLIFFGKNHGSWLIISLLSMLCFALIYVSIQHIVYKNLGKIELSEKKNNNKKVKNRIKSLICWNNVTRSVIKAAFLMYILKKLLNHMFENKSLVYPGMLAVFFLAVYLAMKGKKAFHSFNSVVFPLMAICIGVVVTEIILTTEYKGENDILAMMSMSRENGLCTAIIQAIKQGYGCFFVFCIAEAIMFIGYRSRNGLKRYVRNSLIIPVISGIIVSLLVINLLGQKSLANGTKTPLNIVSALILPGSRSTNLSALFMYLTVVWCIGIISSFLLFIRESMDWRAEGANDTEMAANNKDVSMKNENVAANDKGVSMKNENAAANNKGGKENKNVVTNDSEEDRNKKKAGWVPLLLIVGLWIVLEISGNNFDIKISYLFLVYLGIIDLPMSVLIPWIAVRDRPDMRGMASSILTVFMVCVLTVCMALVFTGCGGKSVEQVDYLRVIEIDKKGDEYALTFVSEELDDSENRLVKESVYETTGKSINSAVEKYNREHVRSLDMSHIEYIVVASEDDVDYAVSEALKAIPKNYMKLVVCSNLKEKAGDSGIREYLESHYEGRVVAAIKND